MNNLALFKSIDKCIYKCMFSEQESDEFNNIFFNMINESNKSTNIVTGNRLFVDFLLEDYPEIIDKLIVILRNYFINLKFDRNARFYNHQYGETKPHIDKNHDGKSQYTLLIYLTDNFDGGKLSIKLKRTEKEKNKLEYNKNYKVFTFTPLKGYGLIFDKSYVHWADEFYDGHKNFLLIHLCDDI
jgi:hypothetical protein